MQTKTALPGLVGPEASLSMQYINTEPRSALLCAHWSPAVAESLSCPRSPIQASPAAHIVSGAGISHYMYL